MLIVCDIVIILFCLFFVNNKLFFVHCNQRFEKKKNYEKFLPLIIKYIFEIAKKNH